MFRVKWHIFFQNHLLHLNVLDSSGRVRTVPLSRAQRPPASSPCSPFPGPQRGNEFCNMTPCSGFPPGLTSSRLTLTPHTCFSRDTILSCLERNVIRKQFGPHTQLPWSLGTASTCLWQDWFCSALAVL